jgi:Predicted transcriptional regulators
LYEEWGFISRAERKANNYRVFREKHLYQMKLARTALPGPYPIEGSIVQGLVRKFAGGDIQGALVDSRLYLDKVHLEKERTADALRVLDRWYRSKPGDRYKIVCRTRKKAADNLGISVDALRTWERNGLLSINKDNRLRMEFSGWDMEKIMVIRLLRNCGFSIASLHNVFADNEKLRQKPSIVLSLPDNNSGISYVTDRYLGFLEEHESRAVKIIDLITGFMDSSI